MHALWYDVRYGIRTLRNDPRFTVVAAFMLALGIGATTTIYSAVNALLLRPFSFPDVERIVAISETQPHAGMVSGLISPANVLDITRANTTLEAVAVVSGLSANLTEGDRPERLYGARVSPNFFSVLGIRPSIGNTFTPESEQPGNDAVMIISQGLWLRRFGGDAKIVGRTVSLNDRSYTIVGVMPADFAYPRGGVDLWTPFTYDGQTSRNRQWRYLEVIARLKPSLTIEQAQAEMAGVAEQLAVQHPDANRGRGLRVARLSDEETEGPRPYLLIGLGAMAFILLLACANVANLSLLRAAGRGKEAALRAALGASPTRIVRGLLVESLLLALLGGSLGLLFSLGALYWLRAQMLPDLAKHIIGWSNIGIDWNVFGFTVLVSLFTGILFGLVPALQASKIDLAEAMKEAGRGHTGGTGRSVMRSALVVLEVALSLVLLIGGGLMIRSFVKLLNADLGFNPDRLLTLQIDLPFLKYPDAQQRRNFHSQLLEHIRSLPGVVAAGSVSVIPLGYGQADTGLIIEGEVAPAPGREPRADIEAASPDYFNTMSIPLLQGRQFSERDAPNAPPVIIVNRTLAREFFGDKNPLGARLRMTGEARPYEIVGVVGDVKQRSFAGGFSGRPERTVYVPYTQRAQHMMAMVVRSSTDDPGRLAPAVQREVQGLDKTLPTFNVRTMRDVVSEAMFPQRVSSFLFAGFAFIALALASVGIYTVISYSVTGRTHEFGVRLALGAQSRDIIRLVIGRGLIMICVGLAIGLAGALAVTRLMGSVLYGVSTTDLPTFVVVPLLLGIIALAACYIPARRATRVNPMVMLRRE